MPRPRLVVTMHKPPSKAYEYATRSIPAICITGFITSLTGHLINKPWVATLGVCLFLSGFAVWGLANGGAFLWGFIHTVRQNGFRDFREHPWSSAFYVFLMLFFLHVGGFFVWFAIRASGLLK